MALQFMKRSKILAVVILWIVFVTACLIGAQTNLIYSPYIVIMRIYAIVMLTGIYITVIMTIADSLVPI